MGKSKNQVLVSGTKTESANGDTYSVGLYQRMVALLNVTNADTDAGDTLDVYVDFSLDGSVWFNGCHFTQIVGTDAAYKEIAIFDSDNPGTDVVAVTSDAAAAKVRPSAFGNYARARWAIVDSGTDNATFTFSVSLFGQE